MAKRDPKNVDLDWRPEISGQTQPGSAASWADQKQKTVMMAPVPSASNDTWTGLIHPRAVLRFFRRRFLLMVSIAIIVTIGGLGAFKAMPDKYAAKALILVDPRQPNITLDEEVISGIAGDAAALTSYVEIMNSDGFLSGLVEDLKADSDPEFAGAGNKTELIAAFRENMEAFRQGATYVVEINYKSPSPQKAAYYANGIAKAFVSNQKAMRKDANVEASQWLSERLTLLRNNLKKSEDAVVAYRADHGIVSTGENITIDSQQLSSLVNELTNATSAMAEAKARYEQARRDGVPSSDEVSSADQFANLNQLLQEQNNLRRAAAQLSQTLGTKHPKMMANAREQSMIASQINQERKRLVQHSYQAYMTAKAKKDALESRLVDARKKAIQVTKASVELDNLEREAKANRNLYEQFLARYKITDEQSQLNFNEARIVSPASVPVKSTKPSIKLVGPALLILGLMLGGFVALIVEAFSIPQQNYPAVPVQRIQPEVFEKRKRIEPEEEPEEEEEPVQPSHVEAIKQEKVRQAEAPKAAPKVARKAKTSEKKIESDDLIERIKREQAEDSLLERIRREQSRSRQDKINPEEGEPEVSESFANDATQSVGPDPEPDETDEPEEISVSKEHSEGKNETEAPTQTHDEEGRRQDRYTELLNRRKARQKLQRKPDFDKVRRALGLTDEGVSLDRPVRLKQACAQDNTPSRPRPIVMNLPFVSPAQRQNPGFLDALMEEYSAPLMKLFGSDFRRGNASLLVSSAQNPGGQALTADLLREMAIDYGYHPVVLSIQDNSGSEQEVLADKQEAKDKKKINLEQFCDFDIIHFNDLPDDINIYGLDQALYDELANLVDLCKANYSVVIVEVDQILPAPVLEDLIELCDRSLLVLDEEGLSADDFSDWQDWASEASVGLVLARAA